MFWRKLVITLRVTWIYFFYFPGLVLHEGSHAIASIITMSQILEIKLFPKITFAQDMSSYSTVYGYVRSAVKYNAAFMLIGLAPFFLWLIPIMIAIWLGWINIADREIYWSQILVFKNIWFVYLLIQISWAGYPSSQDWKVFFTGLFSMSAIIVFGILYLVGLYFFPNWRVF